MNEAISNLNSTGPWLRLMADIEHDDPEQTPSVVYHSHGPALVTVMTELRLAYPRPHGLAQGHMRYCAPCDDWKMAGAVKCAECGAEWVRQ